MEDNIIHYWDILLYYFRKGRQDGSNFFDEFTGLFPGMGNNYNNEQHDVVPSPKSFFNHFSSSIESGRFSKSKEHFEEQPETHRSGFSNRQTASNHPNSREWVHSTSSEKNSHSDEVPSEFRNRQKFRQNLKPTIAPNSQERSKERSDDSERDPSKESARHMFKPRERHNRPASQERDNYRSGETFINEKEGKASNNPRSHEWVHSTSNERLSGSNEVQSGFQNRRKFRQNQKPTNTRSSQEQSGANSYVSDRNRSKESMRQRFKPREHHNRPASRERDTSRSGETFISEKEKKTPNIRRRLHFRERVMATRPPNSQESSTFLSEETFLTDKDPAGIPVRQTFRQLTPTEATRSQERINSRSEEKKDTPFQRQRKDFRERMNSHEYNSINPEKPIERPDQINNNQKANQEESSPRNGETFLTDDEDTLYFPDRQDQFSPIRHNVEENNPSQLEETFLTDKDDFSNIIVNHNDRKPVNNNKLLQTEERLPPQSEETFLTDDEDFPIRKPDNLNQIITPHQQHERSEESFLAEERPLPPTKERFRTASSPSPSSQENNIADNFLTDDDPNTRPPPEKVEHTGSPKHLGRVRWPPPSLDESNEKPPLSLRPLFYEDTMSIVPPTIQYSVETADENEDQDRNHQEYDVKNRVSNKRIRKPTSVGVNSSRNDKTSFRNQGNEASESEENYENGSHEKESSEDDTDKGNGQTPASDESKEDHRGLENDGHGDDFQIVSDDVQGSDEAHGKTHSEDNGHEEQTEEDENVEDSDESPLAVNSPREPPAGVDSEESPPRESGESVPESIHELGESLAEGSEEDSPGNVNESEETDHGSSDELPPGSGHGGEDESDESPPEKSHDSEESPPEGSHNSEEVPPHHEEDSEESYPENNHGSEESSPEENDGSEEPSPESNPASEENHGSGEAPPEEVPPVSNSDESRPNNDVESEEQPPAQNNFSLEELFPHSAEQDKPDAEDNTSLPNDSGSRPPKFESNKIKPAGGKANTYFGMKPFSELFENRPPQEQEKPEVDFEDVLVKSSEEHEEPDFPEIPKRRPNKLKSPSNYEGDKTAHSSKQNAGDVNFSSEINLDSFEFDDVDVLEAPPSSELGSPTTSRPTTTARPTSLPADCLGGDEDDELITPYPFDLLKAKKPIKTVKPSRRPGDEVSIAISGPKALKVQTTKATAATTTPKPMPISAIGVVKPGGRIIAKVVQPSTALPQMGSLSKGPTDPGRRPTNPWSGTNNPRRWTTKPSSRASTTAKKMEPWKAALEGGDATALTYLKPPPLGQQQTWLLTPTPPPSMFRLFVL